MNTFCGTCVYYGYDRPVSHTPINGSEEIIPAILAVDSPKHQRWKFKFGNLKE